MKRVPVELGARGYEVVVGPGAMVEVGTVLARKPRAAIVTQEVIADKWAARAQAALTEAGVAYETFFVGAGEEAKRLLAVEELCRAFTRWGLLRGDAVVALGGGVVGDVAGFAAATYHRGVDVVQCPTTLLAQVDASIGGKTGVNLPEGKNLVGAFHQPLAVLADLDTLASLSERDFRSGLGEVLKYACVLDDRLYELLTDEIDGVLQRRAELLEEIVVRSASVKAEVVAADERERTGVRSKLNYGHTLAHALETAGDYDLAHGEAVAVGVVFAAELARALGRIDDDTVLRHRRVVEALGLPAGVPPALRNEVTGAQLVAQMERDKKARGGLSFVLAGPGGLDRVDDPSPRAIEIALAAVGIEG